MWDDIIDKDIKKLFPDEQQRNEFMKTALVDFGFDVTPNQLLEDETSKYRLVCVLQLLLKTDKKTITKHNFGVFSQSSKGAGHPMMFGFNDAEHFGDFPDGGGYPKRFLSRAFELLGVTDYNKVLHLCSGSMKTGVTVDIRPEMNPTVVADARNTGLPAETFEWILIDPPYTEEYAKNLYGTEDHFPKPGQLLKEAARLLVDGGRVGLLHFMVPLSRYPLKIERIIGVTTGLGSNIRAFTVLRKDVNAQFRNGV